MSAKAATASPHGTVFPRGLLGALAPDAVEKLVAAGGDVALVIDREGVIRDIALSNADLARDGAKSWLDRRWLDTVTVESKPKVDELLRDAAGGRALRWREVNQITPAHPSLMVRYVAVDAGRDGHVIAIGRDERATATVQQRLIEAQQVMERDYSRLRDAEGRYRLLFRASGEAVVVVDAATRKVVEANPAAERLLSGNGASGLRGESFAGLFDAAAQEDAAALLVASRPGPREAPRARLSRNGQPLLGSVSMFRQDRTSFCLVRLVPAEGAGFGDAQGASLEAVLERVPDPFVLTDADMRILTANTAFLDLARIGGAEQATGQSLSRFLGRAGLERNLLLDTLREHGSVRNFRTVLRDEDGSPEDVEISGVAAPDGDETVFGLTIRNVERRLAERPQGAPELPRSVQQLTELVGRMTLKDLVRETTDLVERLCIEAALELTKNNRASAAEVLGLSRQSLYSKLHRFGLGNLAAGET